MQFTAVDREEIQKDFFFHFTDTKDLSLLITSIREIGLITPLPVIRKDGGYQLIAGFSRLTAADQLQLDQIPVRILTPDVSLLVHFYHELSVHLTVAELTLIEQSRVLSIIANLKTDPEFGAVNFAELMHIPENPTVQKKMQSLLSLNANVQEYIARNGLALKQCDMFMQLDGPLQDRIMMLAAMLHIRAVELNVLLQLCEEISGKEKVSIDTILSDDRVTAVLESEELPRGQKLLSLKEYLMRRRYPALYKTNDSLENMRKSLRIPPALSLQWDKNLEKPGLEMRAAIRVSSDPGEIGAWMQRAETADIFEQMLRLI